MIRVADWVFEAAGQEMRAMDRDADAYHPIYLTPAQVTSTNLVQKARVFVFFHSIICQTCLV